jgi:hypothetical protein
VTPYDLTSAQRRLLRYIALGDGAFPRRGAVDQFRTDYTISDQRLEEHLVYLESLGLVTLIEREDFSGRFDVEVTMDGRDWLHDNPD